MNAHHRTPPKCLIGLRPTPSVWCCALLLSGCLASATIYAQNSDQNSALDVSAQNDRVTIRVQDAAAEDIAEALGQATGVTFFVTGDPTTRLSAEIVDESLPHAIATLVPNHMLVRQGATADSPLKEVVLMMPDGADSGSGDDAFLPSGDSAPEQIEPAESATELQDGTLIDQSTPFDKDAEVVDPATGQPIDPNTGLPIDPDDPPLGQRPKAPDSGPTAADLTQ